MRTHKKGGFTLIELMVVISIIGVLASVIIASLQGARAKAFDAQVHLQVRQIINAMTIARDPNTGLFPGALGSPGNWQCLKSSGTCWFGAYNGNTTITTALATIMPKIPAPPNPPFGSTTFLNDSYLYTPDAGGFVAASPRGAYIVWSQSTPISGCTTGTQCLSGSCPGFYQGLTSDGYYMCYQLIGTY